MAAKKKSSAPAKAAKKADEPVAGRYPVHEAARREDETDDEFEARRQAEYPKGVHDPVVNKCPECSAIPPQAFELKMQQEDGSVVTMHEHPGVGRAYQSMLAHYKAAHPDAKVPAAAIEEDVPPQDLLAELLDRTRDADGKVVDAKAKPAEFAA